MRDKDILLCLSMLAAFEFLGYDLFIGVFPLWFGEGVDFLFSFMVIPLTAFFLTYFFLNTPTTKKTIVLSSKASIENNNKDELEEIRKRLDLHETALIEKGILQGNPRTRSGFSAIHTAYLEPTIPKLKLPQKESPSEEKVI